MCTNKEIGDKNGTAKNDAVRRKSKNMVKRERRHIR